MIKKTSSNQLCGRDSEYKIVAFLKYIFVKACSLIYIYNGIHTVSGYYRSD